MKTFKLHLLISLMIFSILSVRANDNQPQGIDLNKNSFVIPMNQLQFTAHQKFSISFWINVKEFKHSEIATSLLDIRDINEGWPLCDRGWMTSTVDPGEILYAQIRNSSGTPDFAYLIQDSFTLKSNEWVYFTYVFDYSSDRVMFIYVDGVPMYKLDGWHTYALKSNYNIMIGGDVWLFAPLNAYIDKVQIYNKALSQAQIIKSMTSPLLRDASLLGYWDFKEGCTVDADGFMKADKGTIKATMHKVIQLQEEGYYNGMSIGTEIQPFVFGEGVDPESVIQGVEENNITESKTKAFVQNEILNIENTEGIDSVVVYDAMGKVITSTNANGATSTQITLPSNTKGVLIVKVNDEVIKVICD